MSRKKPTGKQKGSVQKRVDWKALEIVHPDAAGIDVGGSERNPLVAAFPVDGSLTRPFGVRRDLSVDLPYVSNGALRPLIAALDENWLPDAASTNPEWMSTSCRASGTRSLM